MARKAVKDTTAKVTSARKGKTSTSNVRNIAAKKAEVFNIPLEKLTLSDLVKAVQLAEGNFDCFGSDTVYCDQDACCWRTACLLPASQHL